MRQELLKPNETGCWFDSKLRKNEYLLPCGSF